MSEIEDGTLYVVNVFVVSGKSLRVDLSVRFDRDVRFDNDVNCFVFLEVWDDEFI